MDNDHITRTVTSRSSSQELKPPGFSCGNLIKMPEFVDENTKKLYDFIREQTNEEKYRLLFNVFVENILQDNAEKYMDKTIIGVYKDKLIDMFFDYKGVPELIDSLDKCAFDFVKDVINERPEYFFEIK